LRRRGQQIERLIERIAGALFAGGFVLESA
jgi:hypothetical protein